MQSRGMTPNKKQEDKIMEDWTDYTDISNLSGFSTLTDMIETQDDRIISARDEVSGMLQDILDM